MTTDQLLEEFEAYSELSRFTGWDSKVYSALLSYCAGRQKDKMLGREANLPTDALIMQIKEWIDAEDRLKKIKEII